MAKEIVLAARPRVGSGKREARSLRREGLVPAVAYGADLPATPLSVDGRELFHALHTDAGLNAIVRLQYDGDSHLTLVREIQRHPVRGVIMHVDFVTIRRDVRVTVDVPLHLEGRPPAIDQGAVADQQLHSLHIEVLPLEVPDAIALDISDMQIGDVKRVADLRLPGGVTALTDPEQAVVSLYVPQLQVPEEETPEEAAEAEFMAEGATGAEAEDSEERREAVRAEEG
ncbi:MAG TPA: 50S ribosomal protein L25 [Egibacteraceae bacterium]|nr:50S ribosomal protein L25 [Actinomycetota bacterium]HWB72632.1 50S ribosomal protein L25 [Egibacteraceae bacterium]